MRVGFYLSTREPVERVLPQIARKAIAAGQRMLVVAEDGELRGRLSRALWEMYPEDFLANGEASAPHSERQPVLLSAECAALNGASLVALADGRWREEAEQFDRAFLFFDETGRTAAQKTWAGFKNRPEVEREFHEHEGGKWLKKG